MWLLNQTHPRIGEGQNGTTEGTTKKQRFI